MQKSSWIVLGIVAVLAGMLVVGFRASQSDPEQITQEQATVVLERMREAAKKHDVNTIMSYISPQADTKIVDVSPDQFRTLLARAFHAMGDIDPACSNVVFFGGKEEATLEFDLTINNSRTDFISENYKGHIVLRLKRIDVPRLYGLLSAKEWRVIKAESSGPSLSNFGEL